MSILTKLRARLHIMFQCIRLFIYSVDPYSVCKLTILPLPVLFVYIYIGWHGRSNLQLQGNKDSCGSAG